jgi:protein associated with RNAse G/E
MKKILVHSTKYDGSLHYRYDTMLVREDAALLVVYMAPGTAIQSYRGSMIADNHNLQLYWADRPYNLHVSWYADWRPRNHYINVATPAVWSDGQLHFVDLDLDVIWRSSTGEVILDDEDEFDLHQVRYGYPRELIEQSWRSSTEVRELIAQRSYPFDGSLHSWRPHGAS